eukprot:scaffold33963_cov70-Cyclotella_meneghiniana.AAC.3
MIVSLLKELPKKISMAWSVDIMVRFRLWFLWFACALLVCTHVLDVVRGGAYVHSVLIGPEFVALKLTIDNFPVPPTRLPGVNFRTLEFAGLTTPQKWVMCTKNCHARLSGCEIRLTTAKKSGYLHTRPTYEASLKSLVPFCSLRFTLTIYV